MKVLYFDCFSGISGDMVLGAFLDLGVNLDYLNTELKKLDVPDFHLEVSKTTKKGINGTRCKVVLEREQHCHRHFFDIKEIIEDSTLSQKVKDTSISIFRRVAEAEGKVHQLPMERVHFHEVGAVDSIVDIVGASICYHAISPDLIYGSAINTGKGFVKCAHGIMPVPAPASLEIITQTGFSIYSKNADVELATPTGLAILAELAQYQPEIPKMTVQTLGYGLGERELDSLNALRVFCGDLNVNELSDMVMIETNIDDMTGEIAGYVMSGLLTMGVADVFYTPVHMKKNRPGIKLSVLCKPDQVTKVEYYILKETTSIGVRHYPVERTIMNRHFDQVSTALGNVAIKISTFDDIVKRTAEYEDVKKLAVKSKQSLSDVLRLVERSIEEAF